MTADGPVELRAAQRKEFVSSFVDQAWARPGTERPTARVHVALMITVGCLVVALVVGVVLQLISPIQLVEPEKDVVAEPAKPTYLAVSGWDCKATPDRGFEITGRTPAWYTVARGGLSGDGCNGTFEAIPLSGVADEPDPQLSAVWWFEPGPAILRCELAVYVPDPENRFDAAAMRAHFSVLSGQSGGELASSIVDQTLDPGSWRVLGSFPVSRGGIAVRLTNQGAPVTAADRLAVTQVRADCTGDV